MRMADIIEVVNDFRRQISTIDTSGECNMPTQRRRRNMNKALESWIEDKASLNWSPAKIFREMKTDKRFRNKVDFPTQRTVERVVKEVEIRDKTVPWSVADKNENGLFLNTPEDSTLVLEVLADVILASAGEKRIFTKQEAKWVLRIRKLVPDMKLLGVWQLAHAYMLSESRNEPTERLDTYLAFKPWRNANRFGNYKYAVDQGWIGGDPLDRWETTDRFDVEVGNFLDNTLSVVEGDPSTWALIRQLMEDMLPKLQENTRRLRMIEEQDPALHKEVLKAYEDDRQVAVQFLREWRARPNKELMPKDQKLLGSLWREYNRLLNAFEEGKGK
jgi:hypothetical protein